MAGEKGREAASLDVGEDGGGQDIHCKGEGHEHVIPLRKQLPLLKFSQYCYHLLFCSEKEDKQVYRKEKKYWCRKI